MSLPKMPPQNISIPKIMHRMVIPDPSTIAFSAQIVDGDSGALILPDIETRLATSVSSGDVDVDTVYLRDYGMRDGYMIADNSCDPFVQRLAAIIREQALNDDMFLGRAYEMNEKNVWGKKYLKADEFLK